MKRYAAIVRRKAGPAVDRAYRHAQVWRWRYGPIVAAAKPHQLDTLVIVSLTSYPPRFATLPLTLKCLLSQSVKPDALVLWIAHGDRSYLTKDILRLQERGLTIRFCDDLKSYKKIIPTLEAYPDCHIVTADDDLYYSRSWLELLTRVGQPECEVVALRAHRIRLDENHRPLPCYEWEWEAGESAADPLLFATGAGGVLYPPGSLDQEVFNEANFMRLCPRADDVWLYWMTRRNGTLVRKVGPTPEIINWPESQTKALWRYNQMPDGGNDSQIARMIEEYGFPSPTKQLL